MKTLSLKLSEELDARLEDQARRMGTSKSALVRDAIERMLMESRIDATFADLARDLSGCVDGPSDLSTSRRHLRGYGR
ncbi:MAG: ribbon-helix-helix protein, CopG family [Armatimonadetes bacterium]|nr:ribbon-helix-helix protein, CopG family [Armatimonadota bacterium]